MIVEAFRMVAVKKSCYKVYVQNILHDMGNCKNEI